MDKGIKKNFGRSFYLREMGADRADLHQLGRQLRRRIAQLLVAERLLHLQMGNMDNHTDRINRLLLLWLDLQEALRKIARPQPVPWNCPDAEVTRVWKKITDPDNQRALEEWLYQIAPGEMELWAQRALLECRKRIGRDQSK